MRSMALVLDDFDHPNLGSDAQKIGQESASSRPFPKLGRTLLKIIVGHFNLHAKRDRFKPVNLHGAVPAYLETAFSIIYLGLISA